MSATPLFLIVLRMSLYAGWTALVVMLVRLVLHCGPKRLSYLLWGVVGFRMVCPVSFSGAVSLMPSFSNVVSPQVIMGSHRQTSALFAEPAATAPLPQALASMERGGTGGFWLEIGAWIWLSVAVVLMLWNVVAYLRLRRKMSTAVLEQENIFSSDRISTAFILGFVRPRIYLPTGLSEKQREYILCHETIHLLRKDHWIKMAAMLAVSLHWFNPLLWFSYRLMCRDMEMSCDEKVMDRLGEEVRGDYSRSLLSVSMRQNGWTAPLAFGESDVAGRIQNVLRYRKPRFWILLLLLAVVVGLMIALAANPLDWVPLSRQDGIFYHDNIWGESATISREDETYLVDDAVQLESLSSFLSDLKVTRQPISESRDEERPWEYAVSYYRPEQVSVGNFTLYFARESVWCDNGVKSSFSYGLYPGQTEELFRMLEECVAGASRLKDETGGYYVGFQEVTEGEASSLWCGEDSETGRQLASLLLSGALVAEKVAAVPPVDDYLLIQMGAPETVYYLYQQQDEYYMEKAGDYRLKMAKQDYDDIQQLFHNFVSQEKQG